MASARKRFKEKVDIRPEQLRVVSEVISQMVDQPIKQKKMAAKSRSTKSKTPAYVPAPPALSDIRQACERLNVELDKVAKLPIDLRSEEALTKIANDAWVDLEAIRDAEDVLLGEIEDLKSDLKNMEDERDAEKERIEELENVTVDDIAEERLQGLGPIPYAAENLIDGQIMEAFGVLLSKSRPLELLGVLEALADPRIAAQFEEVRELDKMLY